MRENTDQNNSEYGYFLRSTTSAETEKRLHKWSLHYIETCMDSSFISIFKFLNDTNALGQSNLKENVLTKKLSPK